MPYSGPTPTSKEWIEFIIALSQVNAYVQRTNHIHNCLNPGKCLLQRIGRIHHCLKPVKSLLLKEGSHQSLLSGQTLTFKEGTTFTIALIPASAYFESRDDIHHCLIQSPT